MCHLCEYDKLSYAVLDMFHKLEICTWHTVPYALYFKRTKQTTTRKELSSMGTEAERQDTRKAMAYDLNKIYAQIFDEETCKKIAEVQDKYLETANQK